MYDVTPSPKESHQTKQRAYGVMAMQGFQNFLYATLDVEAFILCKYDYFDDSHPITDDSDVKRAQYHLQTKQFSTGSWNYYRFAQGPALTHLYNLGTPPNI